MSRLTISLDPIPFSGYGQMGDVWKQEFGPVAAAGTLIIIPDRKRGFISGARLLIG